MFDVTSIVLNNFHIEGHIVGLIEAHIVLCKVFAYYYRVYLGFDFKNCYLVPIHFSIFSCLT